MRVLTDIVAPDIREEFRGADLGDARLNSRLVEVGVALAAAPGESFPKLLPSTGELEALYRFVGNARVRWDNVLQPHYAATSSRSALLGGVTRVVHDTSDFVFSGDRDGLGPVMGSTQGFFAHAALAVSGDEGRVPLGLVALMPYRRPANGAKVALNARKMRARKTPRAAKESSRWERTAEEAQSRLPTREVIHVMDQEADDYALFASLIAKGLRFVVRGSSARLLVRQGDNVRDVLAKQESELFRTVPLSARSNHRAEKNRKAHPPRDERNAQLRIRWATVDLHKPQHSQAEDPVLRLNVVQVFEPTPPVGEVPIEWTLFTTERVHDADSATTVVDHYRARWRIEEYFKALKTGCAIQARQLESMDALLVALALFIPIAWRLMLLRSLGRADVATSASTLFEAEELVVLRIALDERCRRELPANPTIRDAMLGVAALGGHIKNNGDPGWLVLGRGYVELVKAVALLRAFKSAGEL